MYLIKKYFHNLSNQQINKFYILQELYMFWNNFANLISNHTLIKNFYQNHVLFCLGISKVITFNDDSYIMDLGTGGGFPGIPLSILFPKVNFLLVDSINKKIKIVKKIINDINLHNVEAICIRAEKIEYKFDFIVTRYVAKIDVINSWIRNKFKYKVGKKIGSLHLKGGNLNKEMKNFPHAIEYPLNHYFNESFFETKKVVWIPYIIKKLNNM